jgi:hypothetical protein
MARHTGADACNAQSAEFAQQAAFCCYYFATSFSTSRAMFVTSKNYLHKLSALIDGSERVDVAVAFWGEGSDALLALPENKAVRVVCNLLSGGTNPEPIAQLLRQGVNVRQLDDLHAKVVLGTGGALVGSANFSTNGLQLEGPEAVGWSEAGLMTTAGADLREIAQWFDAEWARARPIEVHDLKRALAAWKRRRAARPTVKQVKSLADFAPADVKDRDLYIAIWGEQPSPGADAAYQAVVSDAEERELLAPSILERLSFYEAWPNLPNDGILISFERHAKGKYRCDGVWRRFAQLDVAENKKHGGLQIVAEHDDVLGLRVSNKQRKDFEKVLKPILDELWMDFNGPNEGALIPLDQALAKLPAVGTEP